MKVGIIGFGIVGKATANTLSKSYKLVIYDKYQKLDDFRKLSSCDFIFIMVPTPFDYQNNRVDDSAIIESLNKLQENSFPNTVIIKSTVPPGYCKKYEGKYNLQIVFNPEFLRESTTPNEDFENQHTVVIGTDDLNIFKEVKKMYQQVLHSDPKYYHTSTTEAEMIKCAQNTMLASRVALANIIFDACDEHEVDYSKVREIAFDRFEILGPHMVQVPGPDGKRGFGGKCLPKDIHAFSSVYNSELLSMIIKYNNSLRDDLD